ncbi:MAG: DMT family transporter [Chloroflexi bacterium]|nr:DMT family transporter [Chloroflexota bacterium]
MPSIIYGFLSALTWGAADFAGGLASRKVGAYRAVFYADFIGLVAILITVAIVNEEMPPLSSLLLAGLAGILGSCGLLILYYSLAHGQMSIAAPVSALMAAALPVAFGALTEGLPTLAQSTGFGIALASVWLISQTGASPQRFHIDRLADLRLPLLAGIGFGSYFVLMHFATDNITAIYWPMIASRVFGTLLLLVFVLWRREPITIPRDAWTVAFINGVLDVGGNFFYILALKSGRLDISAILSSLYPGGTVILAWLFLKEKISRLQLLGIVFILAAIVLFTV